MGEQSRLVKDCFRAAGGFENIDIVGGRTSTVLQMLSLGGLGGDLYVAVVAQPNQET